MDNLSSHRGSRTRELIEATGASLLYLPPLLARHQPDRERLPQQAEALLRKATKRAVEGLWNTIGHLLELFTPSECANYFATAGYDLT